MCMWTLLQENIQISVKFSARRLYRLRGTVMDAAGSSFVAAVCLLLSSLAFGCGQFMINLECYL